MDGFYVAKFKKMSNKIPEAPKQEEDEEQEEEDDEERVVSPKKKAVNKPSKVVKPDEEEPVLDNEDDEEIIRAAEVKRLKKKGFNVKTKKPVSEAVRVAMEEQGVTKKKAKRMEKKNLKSKALDALKQAPAASSEVGKPKRKALGQTKEELEAASKE